MPVNDISLRLVQFFQSIGAKIDTDLSHKILLFSKKFKGKEKEVAEIALYLNEKGLEINEEIIDPVRNKNRLWGGIKYEQ